MASAFAYSLGQHLLDVGPFIATVQKLTGITLIAGNEARVLDSNTCYGPTDRCSKVVMVLSLNLTTKE